MSFYNMLFGMNSQSDLLLAVIGLRKNDVERFRDVHSDGTNIIVYTRTGGGNRADYPNLAMRKRPEWQGSSDDDFDSTYCTDTFKVPDQWVDDVKALGDIFSNGLRKEFAQHLAATLRREPTESDKNRAAHEQEEAALSRVRFVLANGHTFVPYDDSAMEKALEIAEANRGSLRGAWGILPLTITVKTDFHPYQNAKAETDRLYFNRIQIGYEWVIDEKYWAHCQKRFADKYPVTMEKIAESVTAHMEKKRA